MVKFREWTMKQMLLRMMEWHAHASGQINTPNIGKRIAQWTDKETWKALHDIWGQFDAASSWRALRTLIVLFRRLTEETAQKLGFSYHQATIEAMAQYIGGLYAADDLQDRP